MQRPEPEGVLLDLIRGEKRSCQIRMQWNSEDAGGSRVALLQSF